MKRILILSSSPRKGGNSQTLCEQFAKGAQDAGHIVEIFFLREKSIHCCIGCLACLQTEACVQKDDMAEILDKMLAADVIVLATPVYFYSMSAQMKMLIDRTVPMYERLSNKEFYFMVNGLHIRLPHQREDGRSFMVAALIGAPPLFFC